MAGPQTRVMRNPSPGSMPTLDLDAIFGEEDGAFVGPPEPPPRAVTVHRYPHDLGSPPHEKQMLFEVKQARHLGRRATVGESEMKMGTVAAAALYMPVDALNTAMHVDWSSDDMGLAAGAAMEAFANTGGNTPTAGNIVEKLTATLPAGAKALAVTTASRFAQNILTTLGGGGEGKNILQQMFGQQVDPRTDMLFRAARYRTHTFTFTLIPRNQREAESINNILNLFQFYMLPKYGGGEESVTVDSFFIGYPYEFDITMITMAGAAGIGGSLKSPHINKIDRSVLTTCTINHAAGDHVAFVGNYYPAATSLTLNFTEVRLQGRDSYGGKDGVMWHGSEVTPFDPNDVMGVEEGKAAFEAAKTAGTSLLSGAETIGGIENPFFVGPRQ